MSEDNDFQSGVAVAIDVMMTKYAQMVQEATILNQQVQNLQYQLQSFQTDEKSED